MSPENIQIISLRRRRRGKSEISVLPGGEMHVIPDIVMLRYGVREGIQINFERWQEIKHESELELCLAQGLRLLEQRAHAAGELAVKLRIRHYMDPIVQEAITRLAAAGLLDDQAFAAAFAEEKREFAGWGQRRTELALRRKGISPDCIAEALGRHAEDTDSEDCELQAALLVGRRKWRILQRETDPQRRRHKLFSFLARRGFSGDYTRKVVEIILADRQS